MIKAGCLGVISVVILLFIFILPKDSHAGPKPRCTEADPGSAPAITSITTVDTTVTLNWSQALDPVTHYTLAYGPTKEQLIYGAPDIGPKGTSSYTVQELTKGQRYYFRIRGVNNCEPGDFSDTVSVVVGVNNSDTKLEIPRLSFFRAQATSAATKDDEKWKKGMSVLGMGNTLCTNQCMSIPFLAGQFVALLGFFFLAHKVAFIKPVFSVVIPIIFYLGFLAVNKNCTSYFFFCEYFGILSLILFILTLLVQKQLFLHKLLDPHLVETKKK